MNFSVPDRGFIEKVLQPVLNRLGVSPFQLASSFFVGYMVFMCFYAFWLINYNIGLLFAPLISIMVIYNTIYSIKKCDALEALPVSKLPDITRNMFFQRFLLILLILFFGGSFTPILVIATFLYLHAMYFMACKPKSEISNTPPPPMMAA